MNLPILPEANVFLDQNCFSWIIDGVMQGCINTGRQVAVTNEFSRWQSLFVDPQNGTCLTSTFWRLGF
jgi:hypothetical protein